jgi:YfiH family protein
MSNPASLTHPLLGRAGVPHGFGVRGSGAPPGFQRPRQVHGSRVIAASRELDASAVEADAIVSRIPELGVAIVTADCVPVLACGENGTAVVAIHAGWRGLAAGVVESGIAALREYLPRETEVVAVLGPHIGQCCYEVDAPVLDALRDAFDPASVAGAARATRPGHVQISLADLTHRALARAGIGASRRATLADSCTACGGDRFHSYRRDGERAGRLVHHIAPAPARP